MNTKSNVYKNGQVVSEILGDTLTYYYKSGKLKAKGPYIRNKFEGTWLFYSEDGLLIQEGNFKNNVKDGEWKRYNKDGEIEYSAVFKEGKEIKNK